MGKLIRDNPSKPVGVVMDDNGRAVQVYHATVVMSNGERLDAYRYVMSGFGTLATKIDGITFDPLRWSLIPPTLAVKLPKTAIAALNDQSKQKKLTPTDQRNWRAFEWFKRNRELSEMFNAAYHALDEQFSEKPPAWWDETANARSEIIAALSELEDEAEAEKECVGSVVRAYDEAVSKIALTDTHPLIPESLQKEVIALLHDAKGTFYKLAIEAESWSAESAGNRIVNLLAKLNPKGAKE